MKTIKEKGPFFVALLQHPSFRRRRRCCWYCCCLCHSEAGQRFMGWTKNAWMKQKFVWAHRGISHGIRSAVCHIWDIWHIYIYDSDGTGPDLMKGVKHKSFSMQLHWYQIPNYTSLNGMCLCVLNHSNENNEKTMISHMKNELWNYWHNKMEIEPKRKIWRRDMAHTKLVFCWWCCYWFWSNIPWE